MKKVTKPYWREQIRYAYAYATAAGLTLIAFAIVQGNLLSGSVLAAALLLAAIAQLYIQSRYFLHLDQKSNLSRWQLKTYAFTWLTLLIVVIGSMWIMFNLDYNMMMSPAEMTDYMLEQNAKGF